MICCALSLLLTFYNVHGDKKMSMPQNWTLGQLAQMLEVPQHRVQYLFRARKVPDVRRVGGRRIFSGQDAERIAEALGVSWPGDRSEKFNSDSDVENTNRTSLVSAGSKGVGGRRSPLRSHTH